MYYHCPKCGTHIGFYADYTNAKPELTDIEKVAELLKDAGLNAKIHPQTADDYSEWYIYRRKIAENLIKNGCRFEPQEHHYDSKPDEDISDISMGEPIADTFDKLQALEKRLRELIKEVEEKVFKKNKINRLGELVQRLDNLNKLGIDLVRMVDTEKFNKEIDIILADILD